MLIRPVSTLLRFSTRTRRFYLPRLMNWCALLTPRRVSLSLRTTLISNPPSLAVPSRYLDLRREGRCSSREGVQGMGDEDQPLSTRHRGHCKSPSVLYLRPTSSNAALYRVSLFYRLDTTMRSLTSLLGNVLDATRRECFPPLFPLLFVR